MTFEETWNEDERRSEVAINSEIVAFDAIRNPGDVLAALPVFARLVEREVAECGDPRLAAALRALVRVQSVVEAGAC